MKRYIVCLLMLDLLFLSGCSSYRDVQSMVSENGLVQDMGTKEETKPASGSLTEDAVTNMQLYTRADGKFHIIPFGESYKQYGFEARVISTLVCENIYDISKLMDDGSEGEEYARNRIQLYGPDSNLAKLAPGRYHLNDDGSINKGRLSKLICVRMRLKNIDYRKREVFMGPTYYRSKDGDFFQIPAVTDIGFTGQTATGVDAFFYTFDIGEEMDTVIISALPYDIDDLENVYISTEILAKYSAAEILKGCSMFELKLDSED